MSADEFYRTLKTSTESTFNKRKEIDELRHKMDKLSYKWQKYQYYSQIYGGGDECDQNCTLNCFSGASAQTPSELIFFTCIAPQCKCVKRKINTDLELAQDQPGFASVNFLQFDE